MNQTWFAEDIVRRGCFILSALACVTILAVPLDAQTSFEVGPLVGYYRPVGHFRPASVYSTLLPTTPSELSGTSWGANARLWLGRRFGIDASGMATSRMIGGGIGPGFGVMPARQARVLTVAIEALYDFSLAPGKYRAWVGAGPGLVRHSGDAYASFGSFTDLAGVVSAGASVRLLPHVAAVGQVGTALYNYDIPMPPSLAKNPGQLQSGFQEDLSLRFGLAWTLR